MRELRLISVLAAAFLAACSSSSNPDPAGGTGTPAATATGNPTKGSPKPSPPDNPAPAAAFNDPMVDATKTCTGAPGSLYALSAKRLTQGDDVPLCRGEGRVLLIVNTASMCGNTPQYDPLQKLYAKYGAQGFSVLGFPSPDFGGQEYSTAEEVTTKCTDKYHITFPLFAIGTVVDPKPQPVYAWLKGQPGQSAEVGWNFEKWLISRTGQIVKRVDAGTFPDVPDVVAAIEAEIAKK